VISDDLRDRIRATADEVRDLTRQAELLRRQVEDLWSGGMRALADEHDRILVELFPDGIPDDCGVAFEQMTGYDDTVDAAFHQLMRLLHNCVPDYPYETREPPFD
jgi:hypothetical protein